MVEVASSNLAGPTKSLRICFYKRLFFVFACRSESPLPPRGSARKICYSSGAEVSGSIGCDTWGILYGRRRKDCDAQYRLSENHAAKLENNSPNVDNENIQGEIGPIRDTSRSESFCYRWQQANY